MSLLNGMAIISEANNAADFRKDLTAWRIAVRLVYRRDEWTVQSPVLESLFILLGADTFNVRSNWHRFRVFQTYDNRWLPTCHVKKSVDLTRAWLKTKFYHRLISIQICFRKKYSKYFIVGIAVIHPPPPSPPPSKNTFVINFPENCRYLLKL